MIFTLAGVNREVIIHFCKGWATQFPSVLTRQKLRERYRSFFNFCISSGWLDRAPEWPKIQGDSKAPTLPLSDEEYASLLAAIPKVIKEPVTPTVVNQSHEYWCARVRGLFQLMRWSGLSIMDALTLERSKLTHTAGRYRIVTSRTKTKTDVSVVLPPEIAIELLAIPNDNDTYFFWSGEGSPKSICGNWGKRFISPAFEAAKITNGGYLKAHRLRDTFACHLLSKGVPMPEVSKLLGHTSIKTTEKHYSAWVKSRQDRLDELVMAAW
jgi:integrase/recombinase XerD